MNYCQLESLEEYGLVSQTALRVEVYCRDGSGGWASEIIQADASLTLEPVELKMTMAEVYEDVVFGE